MRTKLKNIRFKVRDVQNRVGKVKSRNLKTTILNHSPHPNITQIPLFIKKRFFGNFISRPSYTHQKSIDSRPEDIYGGD